MSSPDPLNAFVAAIGAKPKMFKKKRLGTKAGKAQEALSDIAEVCSEEQATTYRALAARANYLTIDSPDLAFAAKELCRQVARPTKGPVEMLKRLTKYLVHYPGLV